MVCWEIIWLIPQKSHNWYFFKEIFMCQKRRFSRNCQSERRARGAILSKSLLTLARSKEYIVSRTIDLLDICCLAHVTTNPPNHPSIHTARPPAQLVQYVTSVNHWQVLVQLWQSQAAVTRTQCTHRVRFPDWIWCSELTLLFTHSLYNCNDCLAGAVEEVYDNMCVSGLG